MDRNGGGLVILIVHIRVLKDRVEEFVAATRENAAFSRKEPGISRFELLQDQAEPCRFVLVEGYRDAEAQARHKETPHYLKWKDLAEPMMAEPRTRALYSELDP
jgi:(4S)-4-hydroxy-5-phosphonooxypentane-2,3-dione isomerase